MVRGIVLFRWCRLGIVGDGANMICAYYKIYNVFIQLPTHFDYNTSNYVPPPIPYPINIIIDSQSA